MIDRGNIIGQAKKATIYRMCSVGWTKREESDFFVSLKEYAQFPSAVRLEGKPKGKPRYGVIMHDGQAIIVLEGWNHIDVTRPDVAEAWDVEHNDAGFLAQLDAYILRSGARVLADLRNHNPRERAAA